MEASVFTKTPWAILSDDKYSMGEDAWKFPIEAQDGQRAVAGALADTPLVCVSPRGPAVKIDPHIPAEVSFGFC
jgi:hypothetical protein